MFAATISKSLYDVRVNEDLSRPADARQQPSHDSVVRLAAAALKLVLLDGPFGEGRGLICRLSLVLRKRHPLANDFPARLVVFHVCGSLGCNSRLDRGQRPLLLLRAIAAVWCTRYGQHYCHSNSVRIASPLRADIIVGKDSRS